MVVVVVCVVLVEVTVPGVPKVVVTYLVTADDGVTVRVPVVQGLVVVDWGRVVLTVVEKVVVVDDVVVV